MFYFNKAVSDTIFIIVFSVSSTRQYLTFYLKLESFSIERKYACGDKKYLLPKKPATQLYSKANS